MDSIPADAILDEEMESGFPLENRESADALKRIASSSLSEFARPEKKLAVDAKFNPQSRMRLEEEMETSGSKAVEELVPIEMPMPKRYIDILSGDLLLDGPPPGRKCFTFLDGNFLVVECEVFKRQEFWDKVNGEPEDGPKRDRDVGVIDLIEPIGLLELDGLSEDEEGLIEYLNKYMDSLIPLLEKGAKEMPDREKVINYLVSHRQEIDFFMGLDAFGQKMRGSVVCVHYKNGRSQVPTLMYIRHGLEIEKYY